MGEQYVEIVELACVEIVALGQYVNSDGRPSPAAPDGTGHTGQAGPSCLVPQHHHHHHHHHHQQQHHHELIDSDENGKTIYGEEAEDCLKPKINISPKLLDLSIF